MNGIRKGQTALVTGASTGIGEQFARQLAARGCRLVLLARSLAPLEALAKEIIMHHGVDVEVVGMNLSRPGAAARVDDALRQRGLSVDLLVNNAGFGAAGSFLDLDLSTIHGLVAVNLTALVELTRIVLPAMVSRGSGAILNVASVSAFQPVPFMAVYAATKAAVLSFSRAVAEEIRGTGVTVTALCPGTTGTGFFDRAGLDCWDAFGVGHDPAAVARAGLRAVERRRTQQVVGFRNRLATLAVRLMPPALTDRVSGKVVRRRLGKPSPGMDSSASR